MKNLFILIGICCMFACDTKTTSNQEPSKEINQVNENKSVKEISAESSKVDQSDFLGYYVGRFDAAGGVKEGGSYFNKINISIDEILGEKIKGHSIVAGNDRPFEGTFSPTELKAIVKEPGDDKYDGSFKFEFKENGKLLVGIWESNDKKLRVTERRYKLQKTEFTYNKSLTLPKKIGWQDLYDGLPRYDDGGEAEFLTKDVLKFNASSAELKPKDIENMYKGDLEVIRNSIYARHGYSFKNRKMRYVFDRIDWYIPVSTDIRSKLTALEKKNNELLKRYEGHADRYYDVFGR